ncbi:hypothetical protein CCP2SC5_1980001 [Azospirillaceae bacterium]
MEVVRHDVGGVRSVVLNSPNVKKASWLDLDRMASIKGVYRQIFADCAASSECAAAYPDLDQVFRATAERLSVNPIPVSYVHPRVGQKVETRMSHSDFLDILTVLAGSGVSAAHVPSLVWTVAEASQGKNSVSKELLAWLYMPF